MNSRGILSTVIPDDISITVQRALAEDIGLGDLTAALVPETRMATAHIISRQEAMLCGAPWLDEVFRQLDLRITVHWEVSDGDDIRSNQRLCTLHGPARPLLTGERTALNFLQTLSGIATASRRYAQAVQGTPAVVLDTRKTLPGLRSAQKYAVRCGGCQNHRQGLYDAFLIKENHIHACGSIDAAIRTAHSIARGKSVEVEVENLEQIREAIAAGADRILLDNFSIAQLKKAVALAAGWVKLEASGGLSLQGLYTVAKTGVDYISVGILTKDVHAVDLSMRFLDA
jgi:nicotinate-nucleotide pyrophosphorylase (carboxylating)